MGREVANAKYDRTLVILLLKEHMPSGSKLGLWQGRGSHARRFNENLVTSVENGYFGYKVLITLVASASISCNITVLHVLA